MKNKLAEIEKQYEILGTIDLDQWAAQPFYQSRLWLKTQLEALHRAEYQAGQRIVCTHSADYAPGPEPGLLILKTLQALLNEIDITNCFVVLITTCDDIDQQLAMIKSTSTDPTAWEVYSVPGPWRWLELEHHNEYHYGSAKPIKIGLDQLTDRQRFLLTESRTFCMYPWIHIHAWPTGDAYPCCHAERAGRLGSTRESTLQQLWTGEKMQNLRQDMLAQRPNLACSRCYEQEQSGFFSGRQSANKHHGHHIHKITAEPFELTYWDIRFSNLCNLRCRSCGHIFSSQWYQDQARLAGPEWKAQNSVLNYAGRTETDMWEQLLPHIDYVEQIYFAGGEPLLMEEHYRILEELLKRNKTSVRLIYNTNFTHTDLKGRSVFEYWNQFESVAVGASLDAQGSHAEYIRKGTDWAEVEANRRAMMEICPRVDFYISPTLSILNAWHLPEFHRAWVEAGLIGAQDLNVNILQDPPYYRIDIATKEIKSELTALYRKHIEWLRPRDPLQRATVGFESAVSFLNAIDNSGQIPRFWAKTQELDAIRNENVLDIIPELAALQQ